jgi:hypothetical protein
MVGIAAIVVVALTATVGAVALGRRRTGRSGALASLEMRPAGVRHLAARVSELSDTGLHLPARNRAFEGKHRLGALLGLR